jgi:hypothetical protein
VGAFAGFASMLGLAQQLLPTLLLAVSALSVAYQGEYIIVPF